MVASATQLLSVPALKSVTVVSVKLADGVVNVAVAGEAGESMN